MTWQMLVASLSIAAALAVVCVTALLPRKRMKTQGKHVLITGGSAGIGLALASELVARKANVTLLARTKSRLEAAQAELQAQAERQRSGSKIDIKVADVTDYIQASQLPEVCVADVLQGYQF